MLIGGNYWVVIDILGHYNVPLERIFGPTQNSEYKPR